jgi:hypothetical protein
LVKHTILDISTCAERFIGSGTKRNLARSIVDREVTTLMGSNYNLVETSRRLGTKLITYFYKTSWGTLTRHVRGGTKNHGRGAAAVV